MAGGGRSRSCTPHGAPSSAIVTWPIVAIGAGVVAIAIFVLDATAHLEIAVGALYVAVVLMVVRAFERRGVLLVAARCIVPAVSSHLLTREGPFSVTALVNLGIGVSAVATATYLALRNQLAERVDPAWRGVHLIARGIAAAPCASALCEQCSWRLLRDLGGGSSRFLHHN
jgi:hypothetical protein